MTQQTDHVPDFRKEIGINKEFIPYEQALELKELGFDDECLAYYVPEMDGKYYLFIWNEDDDYQMEKYNPNRCPAPLYQQTFHWFREKHGLHFWIEPNFKNQYETEGYVYYVKNNCPYSIDYATYEEAELACLRKLIEIVREKIERLNQTQ